MASLWTDSNLFGMLFGMARPPKNQMAAEELGMRLSALAERLVDGEYSPKKIERWLLVNFGVEVSDEHIRQAHRGTVDPTTCNLDLLAGLRAFYAVEPEALGRFAAERMQRLLAMAGMDSDGPDDPGEQGIATSTWIPDNVRNLRYTSSTPLESAA